MANEDKEKPGPEPEVLNIGEDPQTALGRLLGMNAEELTLERIAERIAEEADVQTRVVFNREIVVQASDEQSRVVGKLNLAPTELALIKTEDDLNGLVEQVQAWKRGV